MRTIATEIVIDAAPPEVWAVLTDLDRYPEWNPFIREASGELSPGSRLTLRTFPSGGRRPATFRPEVLVVTPGRELRWLGRFFLPGLFDGEHWFRLSEAPGRATRLEHGENFRGLLVPLLGKLLAGTQRDFTALNDALRKHAEKTAAAS
ncbi:SRPBCC domain-containing protein [Streptomyces sp. NPDC051211]|uniref:SRPBCC domain-containing protein n=1 Tax=Streptomyces sp. NPDC051211 TaxID=3154643 RepID=UPI00344CA9E3